ncbi:50S ribosomal protein L25 [Candidatus Peregrinibacteria bacterium]|nr:50S ribosomal protein L25 [Candidatus Peregrinibacteria bacterium]
MEPIIIEVTRSKYGTSKEARKAGRIPIIYYSKDVKPTSFSADYQDFRKAYSKAGKSAIITLIDENKKEYAALAHELQYHPVTDAIIHVDLMAIRKDQKINTEVPIKYVGEAPAVRELGGIFVSNKKVVHIECLPQALPHEIEVDISGLTDFHSSLTVADIKVPDTITILDAEDISIATVAAPRLEEEPVTTAGVSEGEEGAAEEEGKGEGDEKSEEGKKEERGKKSE